MAILPIRIYPDPVLKKTCEEIAEVTDFEKQLIDDMIETMFDAPGAGLAAPQVGEALRIIVINMADDKNPRRSLTMINPQIVDMHGEEIGEEGCLSVPDFVADVKRCAMVHVQYRDRDGKIRELEGHNFLARVIQHEIDHLNGVLFFEHLGRVKRDLIKRKLIKGAKKRAAN